MKKIATKLIVTSLSTVMAFSLVASVVGTLAWYQFNTRATTTVIGTSVANSGVLQISKDNTFWTRDLVTADLIGERANGTLITPVTFGKMNADGSLPAQAYKRPDASENPYAAVPGSYENVYQLADAQNDYIQYSIYLRTLKIVNGGNELVSLPIFLSDILLEGASLVDGLRIHLAIDGDGDGTNEKYFLVSENKIEDLALFGVLDLDADAKADIVGGYETLLPSNREDVVLYGNENEFQSTIGIDDLKANRDGSGDIDQYDPINHNKVLCYTSVDEAKPTKVTVTFWFEGWDNNVDDEEIDAREIIYQEAPYLHAQDVDGFYTYNDLADEYVAASGKAVDGQHYYDVFFKPFVIEEFAVLPADLFTEALGVYSKVDLGLTPVAQPGVKYYQRVATEVTANIRFNQNIDGFYEKSGDDYLLIENPTAVAEDGHKYYEKLSAGETYEAVVLEDGNGDPLPADLVDVSAYYVLDANNNYIHATGLNQLGETYYRLTSAGTIRVPTWDDSTTDNVGFRFGLTFDVGKNAFNN